MTADMSANTFKPIALIEKESMVKKHNQMTRTSTPSHSYLRKNKKCVNIHSRFGFVFLIYISVSLSHCISIATFIM